EPAITVPRSWARLCYELRIDRERADLAAAASDLRETPGWAQISPAQYDLLYQLGQRFLREANPTEYAPVVGSSLNRWWFAGYQALRLFHEIAPSRLDRLTDETWARWSEVIVACPYQGMEADAAAQQALVTRAYAIVPEPVIEAAVRAIDAQN